MVQGRFRLKLFGVPELSQEGAGVLRFRTRKQLALLVYLHFEARRRFVPRDELVDLLWPEVSVDKGRHSLSQALGSIRGHLGSGAVVCGGGGIRLVVPLVTELEDLGLGSDDLNELAEPLQGLELGLGVGFGHWVDRMREGILSRARELLVQRVREARASGSLERVYRWAALLHRLDRVEPVAVLALAERALVDGDTIGAMRAMKEYLQEVAKELGANPHPEIAALLGRLERGEGPALVFAGRLGSAPRLRREVFVSRELELSQLEALWQAASHRVCQTCVITGVAGIGKSTLVRRFAMSVAARALPAYVVACQEIGGGIPFAAVADLILAMGRDPLVAGTDPMWLAEASRVSPALKAIYLGIPEPPVAPAESGRIRVADALVAMLESVADGRPVLLVFDDVHHMDPASRDVLFLLTRRLERVRVVILGTLRAGDGNAGAWAAEAGTLAWERRIALGPLDDASVQRIVDLLGEEEVDGRVREKIVRMAQGNPYHAELLLTDWRQRGKDSLVMLEESALGRSAEWSPPDTFRSAFLAQYHDVSEMARHILHLLAVASRAMSAAEIAEVLNLEVGSVEVALLGTIERGLLRIEGGKFQFKNDLHRAFLYYFIPPNLRKFHHMVLANASWRKRSQFEFHWSVQAAPHFVSAGMKKEAIDAAIDGAELAIASGAPREATSILNLILRAYPEEKHPRIPLLLGEALVGQGNYREAATILRKKARLYLSATDQARRAIAYAESLHRGRLTDDAAINDAIATSIHLSEVAESPAGLVRALQLKAEAAAETGDLNTLLQAASRATAVAEESQRDDCLALAGVTEGFCALVAGDLHTAADTFRRIAPLLSKLSLQGDYRRVMNGLGICLTGLCEFEEAVDAFTEAVSVAERLGNPVASGNSRANLAWLCADLGDFGQAVIHYQEALARLGQCRSPRLGAEIYADVARLALVLGSHSEAREAVERCKTCAEQTLLWQHKVQALLAHADLHLALGQPEAAWPLVEMARSETANRHHLLPNSGQMLRLERHFLFAKGGREALSTLRSPRPVGTLARKGELLEAMLFDEALGRDTGAPLATQSPVLDETLRLGLFGPLARILASHVAYPGIPRPAPGETTAELIVRLFSPNHSQVVPASVGLTE